jgi:isoquinoline 1-oxidoreductase beta subunit
MNQYRRRRTLNLNRRAFIKSGAALGSGLVLAFKLPLAGAQKRDAAVRNPRGFIQIAPDDRIKLLLPSVEMGQGSNTSLPMIILEELEGDWDRIDVHHAPVADIYKNPWIHAQITVGSFSVRGWYDELRKVGAAAREMLVQAAAEEWGVPPGECTVSKSVIRHKHSGRSLSFGQVAARAADLPVPADPPLKPADQYTLIGTPAPRTDTPLKVNGSARYGIDVSVPGMLYATVKTCPVFGGKLKSFDDSAAKSMPGYHATVRLPDGVAVVADSYWHAKKALDKVRVEYNPGPVADLNSDKVSAALRGSFDAADAIVARDDGNATAAIKNSDTMIEAVYEVPYLAHACMEPMNCTADVTADRCEVWVSTQAPGRTRDAAARTAGLPHDKVRVHSQFLGGGFGRRGEVDFVVQAVTVSRTVGRPVKLLWSREEDIRHDFYRPAAAIRFRGGLDKSGRVIALDARVVTASAPTSRRPGPPMYTLGVYDTAYAIPNYHVTGLNKDLGVPFGFWRSVNHSHNPYMMEGFMDELAYKAGTDPYLFRRSLLQGEKGRRHLGALDLAAHKAGWGKPLPSGHYLGIAATEAYGSWIANVAEVSVKDKVITLHKVVSAIDCGVAVNPDTINAQLEGGMVYGLTAALRGMIHVDNGAVRESNFHDYPVLKLNEMPVVETYVLPSSEAPGGVGEPGAAPIAPALANAVFAATGQRLRTLPLSLHGYSMAKGTA